MMKRVLLTAVLFPAVSLFAAGPLAFGLKFGVPLGDMIDAKAPYQSAFKRWTLGPVIDLDLPAGFGAELDMLYKGTGYTINSQSTAAASWEFPLVAKYKIGKGPVRPYVGAGVSFRHLGDLQQLGDPSLLFDKSQGSRGFVMEGGVRFNLKLVKIAPELRYTHWDNSPITLGNLSSQVVNYRQNQVEFLVGITF